MFQTKLNQEMVQILYFPAKNSNCEIAHNTTIKSPKIPKALQYLLSILLNNAD